MDWRSRVRATVNPSRPPLSDAVRIAHEEATRHGSLTYRDPVTGYEVMTAAALEARKECCGSGCRHCPYPNAPSPDVQ
ncbi:MAG: DUF5522 domain-containing protein [Acidimicrobiia bacterium]